MLLEKFTYMSFGMLKPHVGIQTIHHTVYDCGLIALDEQCHWQHNSLGKVRVTIRLLADERNTSKIRRASSTHEAIFFYDGFSPLVTQQRHDEQENDAEMLRDHLPSYQLSA